MGAFCNIKGRGMSENECVGITPRGVLQWGGEGMSENECGKGNKNGGVLTAV